MKTAPVLAALILAAFVLHPSTLDARRAPKPDDSTILAIFDAANTRDIEHGQLAVERGTMQAVRASHATITTRSLTRFTRRCCRRSRIPSCALVVQVAPAFKAHLQGAEALLQRLTAGK